MKIALIQPQIHDYEIEKNFNNLESICKDIPSFVDWIVFPEMFMTGFVVETSLCKDSQQKGLDLMRNLAKRKACATEGSLLIESNAQFFNRHYFITEDQESYYDKQKLFSLSDEAKVLTAGTKSRTVSFKNWKISLRTCYDLRFADICKNEYVNGSFKYDVLCFTASWPKSRSKQWKILLQARAIENQCYVIGVNRCGTDSYGTDYSGDSCIVDMKGNFLQPLDCSSQNVFYYDIDKESLDKGREKFPVYTDW
ncbi:MAG: hypothetical protein IJ681_06755 [Bacteroidales bacterium]|nr:hypothetical protein [Bacteroidales bacterium]